MEEEEKHRRQKVRKGGRGSESALYEVVCPAVYVIRVFGLAPYEFAKDNRPPRLRASGFNCLYSLFWIAMYSYIVVQALMRFGGIDRDKPVLGVTENGKLILNYVVSVADLTLNVLTRNEFVHIWNSIQDFDESFHLGDAPIEEHQRTVARWAYIVCGAGRYGPLMRQARIWVWSVLVSSVIGWTSVNQLGMHAFNEPYLMNLGYMVTYVGTCVSVLKLCGLIFLLGQRFAYLNGLVREQLRIQTQRPAAVRIERELANVAMKKIETSYDQLLSTSEKLNDIYSWSLFLFLFNLFCHAVCNMYFFTFWTIVDANYLTNPLVVFCEFSWLVVYLIQLLLVHVACHYASIEANLMPRILLDWRRRADRQSKQNEFSSTLHFLNRKLNFTAAGCFNVNLPLLTSTFGHLTTYLVILLQLPSNSDS